MPRRKQGYSKERAPCGYLKKTNPGNELVQNESFKYFPTKNEIIKFKKSTSSNFSSSTSYEKIEREHIGVSKSLNDITVLRQEINNNFVEAQTEPNNNQNGKDVQQSSIISKNDTEDKCNSNLSFSSLPTSSPLNTSNTVPFVTPQNGNKMLLVIQENSDLTAEKYPPFKVQYSNAPVPCSLPYAAQVNDLSFSKRNGDIENEMQNAEMSGISPSTTSQYGNKIKVDLQQINYRISTSVIENNKTQQMETTSVEGQSFHLPSSIYGTPASAVEKMLTNQQMPESKISKEGKTSFLQEILEQKSVKSKVNSEIKNDKLSIGPDSFVSATTTPNHSLPMSDNERPYPKLKLNIPDGLVTDDSNSSVFSTESSKSLKFPRITSPQILEQHINKLISNNIAIIDTVDAVWSRRYSKQLNTPPAFDGESKKVAQKSDKSNDEKIMQFNFLEGGSKSKLHSALLRGSEEALANPHKNSLPHKIPTSKDKTALQINNTQTNTASVTPYTKVITSVSEDELKGSAIKSLLSLRQGQYMKETNAFTFDKDAFAQHPQNPEGSIIKDLLLKSKSQEDLRIHNDDNFYETTYRRNTMNPRLTIPMFKCSRCNADFSDKFSFENHCALCSNYVANNLLSLRDHVKDRNAQPKSLSLEYQNKWKKLVQPDNLNTVSIDDDDGPILKKQLLMPLAKSPPIKRRKVSDSVISPSYFSNQNTDLKNFSTKLLNSDLMPYRSRSQSVHLFGGEVQVMDGYRTKKIKIQNLPGAFSTLPKKFTDNSVVKPNFSTDMDNDVSNLSAALVTIAQPVHNSGGTLHLPTRPTTSCLTPAVSVLNAIADVSNYTRLDSAIASSNISKTSHITSNRDTQFPLYNKSVLKQSQTSELFYSSKDNILPGPPTDELSSSIVKTNVSPSNKLFYSPIFSTTDEKFEASTKGKDTESKNSHIVPTVLFTPSSPTFSAIDEEVSSANSISESNKKFLAPTRPTSLPLKKKAITMVSFGTGTTLISPETPRPKKNCVQLYLNGHAYTYLGLKCSTRPTYCCIYRPQPMFVLQETNPKLSMYSNWQVVPAKEELSGFTPGQMISFYCSKQKRDVKSITSVSKLGEPLIFTHSSYWTYRSKDSTEQKEMTTPVSNDLNEIKISTEAVQESVPAENVRSESVITIANKLDRPFLSGDESSIQLDTENTLSDGDVNNSNDEDDDDCQDDGAESLTDSSQPQPPKRVKIFEGGFKSNEDYTYVRGRGRGKYVCEECGIRCKKPSMLKKHIRTHTDLRPYKCRHCSFAFKTKGNLTKHMKSKAHHKKCTELGIIPVPTTTDDSQIDAEALAKQIEKKKNQFSDGDDADDDDEEDTDESDDECESDASSLIVTSQNSRMLTNGHSKKSDAQERSTDSFEESIRTHESTSQQAEEHEVARSLLNLSAFGEPSQWSTSTGDLTDVTSPGESDVGSLIQGHDQSLLSPSFVSHGLPSTVVSSTKSKAVSDQWLSTETLGHRPRSYSADIPLSGAKHVKYKLVKDIIAETGTKLHVDESSEFGSKDQYARRYSISVAREARKPRTLNSQEWASLNISSLSSRKWRDSESADQPMDLSITRDLGKCKSAYSAELPGSLMNMVTQEEALSDMNLTTSLDSCLSEAYQLKPLPVLSPQVLVEYETSDNNNADQSLLPLMDDQSSLGTSTRSIFYMQDVPSLENVAKHKDTDIIDDPSSPDMVEYAAVCSPVSPPALDDSAYYYSQEGGQPSGNTEESASSSRHQAEFIVPSTSSSGNIEEGKCVCRICNKMFAKSSHLRLHVNIHYFERPFRCDNCAVSFRTKGHLQKHKRSVSHYNKVNMNLTFGTPTVDNPRPFKCADCKIAFRIHGHLAKHLRSKMHIMKLECLGKLPFGMYAEMERSGVSLNEIDTTDCNNSLESLQVMAQKLYQRDPRRMRWQGPEQTTDSTCVMPTLSTTNTQSLIDSMLPLAETLATSFDSSRIVGIPVSTLSSAKQSSGKDDVKQETSQTNVLHLPSTNVGADCAISSLPRYIAPQTVTSPGQDIAPPIEASALESSMSLNRSGTCHICGRHFKSAKFLQVHLYCDHPTLTPSTANETPSVNVSPCFSESGELICDLCGKQFPNQKVLQQHLLSHAKPRPFVCEICDAGFTSSSSLVAHQVTHQNNPLVSTSSDNRIVKLK